MRSAFSHLPKRTVLALAHPVVAAYAPKLFRDFRDLHIFARAHNTDHTDVEVSDGASVTVLKQAIIAELKLDIAPSRVRLLREMDGQDPVPLDSRKKLAVQGVLDGSSVFVEVIAPAVSAASAAEPAALEDGRRLLSALRAAKLEAIPSSRSGLIKLPEGALWPQLGAQPLFVRDFYSDLYEGPLAECDPSCTATLRKFTIRGNAGIGKSAFGVYMLWRAVKAGRTVVYTSDKVLNHFIFHGSGQVEVFPAGDFERRTWNVLNMASTVLICDSIKPPVAKAFSVLITSPKRERYKEYNTLLDCWMLTLPVFFRHEIKDILCTCFPHLLPQEKLIWALYEKWGGIVRYVMGKLDVDSQLELDDAFTGINLEELFFHLGKRAIESEESASHRLLHLKPVGEGDSEFLNPRDISSYALGRTELASPYVKERLYKAMQQRHFERLNQVLAQPITASYAKLYGDLYEVGATRKLLRGGKFEAFDCSTGAAVDGGIAIPSSTRHTFSSVESLRSLHLAHQGGEPCTYVPASSKFTAVDAVLPNDALVNFTINVKHEAKMHGLGSKCAEGIAPVADALGVKGDIVFYWVLPRARYEQACKAKAPFAVTGQRPGDARKVKQYFVCVPFDFDESLW